MRITETQLRRIIRQECIRPQGRQIQESAYSLSPRAGTALDAALDDIRSTWMNWASKDASIDDPQAATYIRDFGRVLGAPRWEKEVNEAVEDLRDLIMTALHEVEEDLINGEYL